MLDEHALNINTTDRQLLYDIRQEMRKTNQLLQAILNNDKPEVVEDAAISQKRNHNNRTSGNGSKYSHKRQSNNDS